MIKHIVMFRLKEFAEGSIRRIVFPAIYQILEKLIKTTGAIIVLDSQIEIIDSEGTADIQLILSFESKEDLDLFINHPDYKVFVAFILKEREDCRVVDYEV